LDGHVENHICLGQLAERLSEASGQASERLEVAFMCLLTRALFEGDFDAPKPVQIPFEQLVSSPVLPSIAQVPVFVWHMKQPETDNHPPDAFLGWRDGDQLDVVVLLKQFECLPHEAADYPQTIDNDSVLDILAGVPYSRLPVTAQALIDNVWIARPKLRLWLAERGLEVPDGLAVDRQTEIPATEVQEAGDAKPPQSQNDNARLRGRPSKKAWAMIIEQSKRLHSDDPSRLKKCVANDVYELALEEFGPEEVPSPATIQRRMKDILGGSS